MGERNEFMWNLLHLYYSSGRKLNEEKKYGRELSNYGTVVFCFKLRDKVKIKKELWEREMN